MKLHATLENGRGKVVSLSDNETITATVYEGNKKAYSVTIALIPVIKGALISTVDWRK